MKKQSKKKPGLNFQRRIGQSFVIIEDGKIVDTITLTKIGLTRASFNIFGDGRRVYRSELWAQMQKEKQAKEITDGTVTKNQGLAKAV